MRALDAAEFDGTDLDVAVGEALTESRSPLHPGAAGWVRHACSEYVRACRWLEDELAAEGVALRPESRPRVVQHGSPAELRMLTAWGRWYASEDGAVREFRRLRISRTGPADAPSAHAIAFVAATGLRAVGAVYRDLPVEVRPDDGAPARIRVVEVALAEDVMPKVLVDAAPEEVRRGYRVHAQPVAADLAFGGERRPGADCAECKLRESCDALPRTPGLLGLADRGTHRRTWSVTTGRQYQICPAQAHLRELRIPGDHGEESPAVRRGRVVHEWLAAAHSRTPTRPCTPADLPEPDAVRLGLAGEFMTPEEYREARPFLIGHLEVCPLAGSGAITGITAEPTVAAYDPAADVVVIAGPDLLRRVDGRLVYREQKTTTGPDRFTADGALAQVPQLALAVCLIADGVFGGAGGGRSGGGGPVPGTVELEVMSPLRAGVLTFDTADPAVVGAARRIVTGLVRDWHHDTAFRARPGRWCTACPVARWCPDRAGAEGPGDLPIEVDGVLIDPRTGEVLEGTGLLSGRAEAVSAAIADPEPDEEPPF
ncbi:PD-(D/E)XK nuclease family protein [Actinomadura scrupuli]|uniref:PD-(D/E)XK nuclease family protein n=1 Tax=Actinomadura scrupuli TaxID=559629 RepID=UPI003D98556E